MSHLISLIADGATSASQKYNGISNDEIKQVADILTEHRNTLGCISVDEIAMRLTTRPIISENKRLKIGAFISNLRSILTEANEEMYKLVLVEDEDEDDSYGSLILQRINKLCLRIGKLAYETSGAYKKAQKGLMYDRSASGDGYRFDTDIPVESFSHYKVALGNSAAVQAAMAEVEKNLTGKSAATATANQIIKNLPPVLAAILANVVRADSVLRGSDPSRQAIEEPLVRKEMDEWEEPYVALYYISIIYDLEVGQRSAAYFVNNYYRYKKGSQEAAKQAAQQAAQQAAMSTTGRADVKQLLAYQVALDNKIRHGGIHNALESIERLNTPLATAFATQIKAAMAGKAPSVRDFLNQKLFNTRLPLEQRQHYFYDFLLRLTPAANPSQVAHKEQAYRADLTKHLGNMRRMINSKIDSTLQDKYGNRIAPEHKSIAFGKAKHILDLALQKAAEKIGGSAIVYKTPNTP
jgi:hypothetical protein